MARSASQLLPGQQASSPAFRGGARNACLIQHPAFIEGLRPISNLGLPVRAAWDAAEREGACDKMCRLAGQHMMQSWGSVIELVGAGLGMGQWNHRLVSAP